MNFQNGKKRPKRFSAHHIAKKRIITVIVIIIIVIFICLVTWKSLSYAEAIFEAIIGLCAAGGVIDAIFYFAKREKFNAILFAIAIFVIIANAVCARATLSDINVKSESGQFTKASSENINDNEKKKINNSEEKDINEFVWHDDIYMIGASDYLNSFEDKGKCFEMLIEKYTKFYVSNLDILEKSDEELNAGDFGKFIGLAKKYEKDYENCNMNDVKMYALDKEIEMREFADKSYKKYDNLKILGDRHVNKITLSGLAGNNKKGELEKALKYYIEALAYAQNNKNTTESYISKIWDEIIRIYKELYDSEEVDDAHKNQILEIIEACQNCRYS